MLTLTEDDIKRAFLPFLKSFYKYRYEYKPESVQSTLDSVGDGGVVADGMLRFSKTDGTIFTCTYEATSRDKAEEVKYSLNTLYFFWDCMAFGAAAMAVLYVWLYVSRLKWLIGLKFTGNLGLLIGLGMIGFFAWYYTMRGWKKYRYIYAVEQFKQYFADEQWIALAEDVFPAPTDPYLLELKNQCIYNGFGLAVVPAESEIRVHATPSRLGMYGKDRKMIHWVTRTQWYQAISQNMAVASKNRPPVPDIFQKTWNILWQPLRYYAIDPLKKRLWALLSQPLGRTTSVMARYMHAHKTQQWVFGLSLALIGFLGYKVNSYRSLDETDLNKLEKWRRGSNPEDKAGYVLDEDPVPYDKNIDPGGIPKQFPQSVTRPGEETVTIDLSGDDTPTINLSGDEEEFPAKARPAASSEKKERPAAKPAGKTPAPTVTNDPCTRLGKGWIVQDNVFSTQAFADERLAALRKKNISCDAAPRSCFETGKKGYLVWLGKTQPSEQAAREKVDAYTKILQKTGLGKGPLMIRNTGK